MPIIIDGWNLIRDELSDITDDDRDSLEAAAELISCLIDFQAARKDPIILVFDSSNEFLGLDYTNSDKLKVVCAKDADIYIKKYIDGTPERQRRNLRVISSDGDVFHYAKLNYASPIRSADFWKKLTGS